MFSFRRLCARLGYHQLFRLRLPTASRQRRGRTRVLSPPREPSGARTLPHGRLRARRERIELPTLGNFRIWKYNCLRRQRKDKLPIACGSHRRASRGFEPPSLERSNNYIHWKKQNSGYAAGARHTARPCHLRTWRCACKMRLGICNSQIISWAYVRLCGFMLVYEIISGRAS